MKLIKIIVFCLVLFLFQVSCAQKQSNMRIINIAGLVIDSESLSPIEGANVYNNDSKELLTKTNQDGYFKSKLNVNKEGEIEFSLKIEGQTYDSLIQNERWGNLPGNHRTIYYFGLKQQKTSNQSFSELGTWVKENSYESILIGLGNIKEKKSFNKKMQQILEGNQDVFFEVEGGYYIVNDGAWIKLNTKDDLISIDGGKGVLGNKLNSLIKRKNIIGMSPIESKNSDYIIYTKQ